MPEPSRRRSERLLLTFPIRVEGTDTKDQAFSEDTRTIVINRHGARIRLKQSITAGQNLRITNLVGNRTADFRVVGLTRPLEEWGGEWGVECRDERRNIWGIQFPPRDTSNEVSSAVLECRRCGQAGLTPISLVEFDVLESARMIARECRACGETTSWGYSASQVGVPPPEHIAELAIRDILQPPPPVSNRRAHRRMSLRLPVRVRSWYGVVEYANTENVSKGGLAFASDKRFEVGEALFVTCPYNPDAESVEVRARVVRCSAAKGVGRFVYGVRYETEV